MLLLLLVYAAVRATVPQHAALVDGCGSAFSNEWLAAAQDEAIRSYHTLNGGWLDSECCGARANGPEARIKPFAVDLHAIVCIVHASFPKDECVNKKCNFQSHPQLYESDCGVESQLVCPLAFDPRYIYNDISACANGTELVGTVHYAGGDTCNTGYVSCPADAPQSAACTCTLPSTEKICSGTWRDDGRRYGAQCTPPDDSCRTVESWLKVGQELLTEALDKTELCEWDAASSAACAAEFVYRRINQWTLETYSASADKLQFISPMARATQRYTHINSPLRQISFETTLFSAKLRVVQSVRSCASSCSAEPSSDPVTSLLVYTQTESDANTLELSQLVWALAGVLADFGTVLPFAPANGCGAEHVQTNLALFDPQRRVPRLGAQDWATVRCDGAARETVDLRINAICPVVLLFAQLHPAAAEPSTLYSLAQLQLRDGFAPLDALAAAELVESGLAFRVATGTGGECRDYKLLLASSVFERCALAAPLLFAEAVEEHRDSVPLTLAPGESRCVGGTAAGRLCTAANECGRGLVCRHNPFAPRSTAFCYDGLVWDETKPCTGGGADEATSCPYGTCVGAINGLDGGLFPLLHHHQASDCQTDDSDVCAHPAVAAWHKYPNLALFANK